VKAGWVVPTVSASVGVICIAAAAAVWIVGQRHTPRLVIALAIAGTIGILGTPVGRWLHHGVDWANGALANLTGKLFGTAVAFVGAAILTYYVAVRVWRKRIDDRTVLAAAALPLIVTLIPGTVGAACTTVVFSLGNAVGYAVGALFGHTGGAA
jgi:hypothetical protein